jgi:drug/metabolite transporter (DMT)-like permease
MGIIVGLLNAGAVAALSTFIKKLSGVHPHVLLWLQMVAALPVLAVLVSIFAGWSFPPLIFWLLVLGIKNPLEILLAYVKIRAFHISPISIVGPLSALTSIFLIPVGFVLLGELPTLIGFLGVFLVVLGSLVLSKQRGRSFLTGLRSMFLEKGSLLAILGAFIASITMSIAKVTFQYTTPLVAAFYAIATLSLMVGPLALRYRSAARSSSRFNIIGLGISSGLGIGLNYIGLSLLPVVYYTSIKRMSIVFNVLTGRIFFKEDHIRERLMGAILLVAGVVFIAMG